MKLKEHDFDSTPYKITAKKEDVLESLTTRLMEHIIDYASCRLAVAFILQSIVIL